MREAMDRLNALPPCSKQAMWWRIVATAIVQVGSYSRVSDTVAKTRLAEACGVAPKTVQRALDWAVDLGIIAWAPDARGDLWRLTLPTPRTDEASNCPNPEDTSDVELSLPPGQLHAPKSDTEKTREVPEKETEENPSPQPPSEPLAVVAAVSREGLPSKEGWGLPQTLDDVSAAWPVTQVQRGVLVAQASALIADGLPLAVIALVAGVELRNADSPAAVIRYRFEAVRGMSGPEVWAWLRGQRLMSGQAAVPNWAWATTSSAAAVR